MYKLLIYVVIFVWTFVCGAKADQNCELFINGHCTDCNSLDAFEVTWEETCKALCPNRKIFGDYSPYVPAYCALDECPKEYPVRNELRGDCSAGEKETSIEIEFKKMDEARDKYRIAAKDGKCPPDKPMKSSEWCYPCDYPFGVMIRKEMRASCPNRISIPYTLGYDEDLTELFLPCPEDKPLRSWNGTCLSCDYPDFVPVLSQCLEDDEICDVCPNRVILYQNGGNRPSILKCPPDKPLMDEHGICFGCDIDVPIRIVEVDDCKKYCPSKREMYGWDCIKIGSKDEILR